MSNLELIYQDDTQESDNIYVRRYTKLHQSIHARTGCAKETISRRVARHNVSMRPESITILSYDQLLLIDAKLLRAQYTLDIHSLLDDLMALQRD